MRTPPTTQLPPSSGIGSVSAPHYAACVIGRHCSCVEPVRHATRAVDAGLAARLDARRRMPRACLLRVPHACVALTHVADQPSGAAHRPIVPQPDQVKSSQVKSSQVKSSQVKSSQVQPTPRPLLRLHGHLSTATSTIHWQHGHPFPRGEGAAAAAVITAASSPRCYFPRPAPIRASICATSARPLSASHHASLVQPPRHLRAISAPSPRHLRAISSSCCVSPQGASRHPESSPLSPRLTRPRCRPRRTPACALRARAHSPRTGTGGARARSKRPLRPRVARGGGQGPLSRCGRPTAVATGLKGAARRALVDGGRRSRPKLTRGSRSPPA